MSKGRALGRKKKTTILKTRKKKKKKKKECHARNNKAWYVKNLNMLLAYPNPTQPRRILRIVGLFVCDL